MSAVRVCAVLPAKVSTLLSDSGASPELVKQKTPRRSFSIWPTWPRPTREALQPGTRSLRRYVRVGIEILKWTFRLMSGSARSWLLFWLFFSCSLSLVLLSFLPFFASFLPSFHSFLHLCLVSYLVPARSDGWLSLSNEMQHFGKKGEFSLSACLSVAPHLPPPLSLPRHLRCPAD